MSMDLTKAELIIRLNFHENCLNYFSQQSPKIPKNRLLIPITGRIDLATLVTVYSLYDLWSKSICRLI